MDAQTGLFYLKTHFRKQWRGSRKRGGLSHPCWQQGTVFMADNEGVVKWDFVCGGRTECEAAEAETLYCEECWYVAAARAPSCCGMRSVCVCASVWRHT